MVVRDWIDYSTGLKKLSVGIHGVVISERVVVLVFQYHFKSVDGMFDFFFNSTENHTKAKLFDHLVVTNL